MAFPSDLSRDSTSPEHMQLKAGQRVFNKRYELIEKVGSGGMGVVWLAQDQTEHTAVALKFLPTILVHHSKEMDRLREEVRIGKELRHDLIVATYGLEVEGHLAAIVLEFVKGETLKQKLEAQARGFFEPQEIDPWLQDITSALVYLHEEKQRLHRDLKPANLILDPHGRARLMDFGISQTLQETMGRHTQTGAVQGTSNTLAYASPESLGLRHKPAVTDDIYSLGATLYELLTGTPPFYQGTPAIIALHIETKAPPSVMQRRAELEKDGINNTVGQPVDARWQAMLDACLAKDPAQRPRTAADVRQHLSAEAPIAPRSGVRPAAERATPDTASPRAGPGTAAGRPTLGRRAVGSSSERGCCRGLSFAAPSPSPPMPSGPARRFQRRPKKSSW
jgi:serine/threonine protein kinase